MQCNIWGLRAAEWLHSQAEAQGPSMKPHGCLEQGKSLGQNKYGWRWWSFSMCWRAMQRKEKQVFGRSLDRSYKRWGLLVYCYSENLSQRWDEQIGNKNWMKAGVLNTSSFLRSQSIHFMCYCKFKNFCFMLYGWKIHFSLCRLSARCLATKIYRPLRTEKDLPREDA